MMLMTVLVAGIFWSLFVFDMVGDVYGSLVGGLVIMVPLLGALVVCVILMTVFNTANASVTANPRAVTGTRVSLTVVMNPVTRRESDLNSDFMMEVSSTSL